MKYLIENQKFIEVKIFNVRVNDEMDHFCKIK